MIFTPGILHKMLREEGGEAKYQAAYVNEPMEVLKFLSRHLGFFDRPSAEEDHPPEGGIITGNSFGNNFLLISRTALKSDDGLHDVITVHTPDLLKDYRRLRSEGVKVVKVPRYTGTGLELIFSDNYGNCYFLVEKRDYKETI